MHAFDDPSQTCLGARPFGYAESIIGHDRATDSSTADQTVFGDHRQHGPLPCEHLTPARRSSRYCHEFDAAFCQAAKRVEAT